MKLYLQRASALSCRWSPRRVPNAARPRGGHGRGWEAQGGNFPALPGSGLRGRLGMGWRGPGGGGDRGRGQGTSLTHRPPPAPGRGSAPTAATAPRPAPAAAPPGGHRRCSAASHDTSSAHQRHPVRRHLQRESRSASPLPGAPHRLRGSPPRGPRPPWDAFPPTPPPSRPRGSPGRDPRRRYLRSPPPPEPAVPPRLLPPPPPLRLGSLPGPGGAHTHTHTRSHATQAHRDFCAPRSRPALPASGAGSGSSSTHRPGPAAVERRRGEPRAAGARAAPARQARMAAAGTAEQPLPLCRPGSPARRGTPCPGPGGAPKLPRVGEGEGKASLPVVSACFHLKRGYVVHSTAGASLECPVLCHVHRALDTRHGLAALVPVPHLSQFLGVGRCLPEHSRPSAASGKRQDAWACRLEQFTATNQHPAIFSESVKFTATNH